MPNRLDPKLIESFKSNAELGKHPRGIERREPAMHGGISVFKTLAQAVELRRLVFDRLVRAGRADDLAMGDYVAKIRLTGTEFCVQDRNAPNGHMTLWGDPSRLAAATVEIVPATSDLNPEGPTE